MSGREADGQKVKAVFTVLMIKWVGVSQDELNTLVV
jgi:hypothetical protein